MIVTTTPHPYEQYLADAEHCQRIERIARKQTYGSPIAWEDAAQVAQIKILQSLRNGKFRYGEVSEFYRWATTVARFEIIDLIRREKSRSHASLDAHVQGTDLPLLDTIADEFDTFANLERTDLVMRAIAVIQELDQQYPNRRYLTLWQGQVEGKKQTQLAMELGVTQSEISKRWSQLVSRVAFALGVEASNTVKQHKTSKLDPKIHSSV